MNTEELATYTSKRLLLGQWRVVRNRRRARVLLKRGEGVAWNSSVNAWVWDWQYRVRRNIQGA